MKIRMGGYYLHESGNSILRVSMVVTFKSGVQQVSGRFVNRNCVVDNYACKRDDFLENFRALPKKAALEQLTSWGVKDFFKFFKPMKTEEAKQLLKAWGYGK